MDLYILYGALLAVSPAFGLEALMLAMKRSASPMTGGKTKLLAFSTGLGLAMVGISIGAAHLLLLDSLSPPFLSAVIIAIALLLGWPVSFLLIRCENRDEVRVEELVPKEELKDILRDFGEKEDSGP